MRILILGAGGIGGYFGGRMVDAGIDVTFLVRPRRREQLARDGLIIRSPRGDLLLSVNALLAEELRPDYDFVLFTCKAYDLPSAMDAVAPAMRGRCALVPLLNGIAHLQMLDERFGRAHIMGGVAQIAVTLDAQGVIRHGDALQRLIFGERDGSLSPRAKTLAEALGRTTIDWTLSTEIEQDLWEKIVFLSALAATTCLFRGNVGEINGASGGREAMEIALETNVEIANREGHAPRPTAIEFARKRLMDPSGTWQASMLRDLEAGGRVEADHIIGWMLHRARAHGLDDTILSLAYTHLKTYERRRATREPPAPIA